MKSFHSYEFIDYEFIVYELEFSVTYEFIA